MSPKVCLFLIHIKQNKIKTYKKKEHKKEGRSERFVADVLVSKNKIMLSI